MVAETVGCGESEGGMGVGYEEEVGTGTVEAGDCVVKDLGRRHGGIWGRVAGLHDERSGGGGLYGCKKKEGGRRVGWGGLDA